MSELITLKKVNKKFYNKKVLNNINFSINSGQFIVLLGENGAGKSTILNLISGPIYPDKGEILLFNQSIYQDPANTKEDIAIINEKINFNVPTSLITFIKSYQKNYKKFDQEQFFLMMKERNIDCDLNYNQYSRGQKMQVQLIGALARNPKVMLIDEITSVLDVDARRYFLTKLNNYMKFGGCVLMTTNIIEEIEYFATRLLMLIDGEIKIDVKKDEIEHHFIKIRKKTTDQHAIFDEKNIFLTNQNSDGSTSYIVPKTTALKYSIPDFLYDRRSVTLEDLFIYYNKNHKVNA